MTTDAPGSAQGLMMAVENIEAARDALARHGAPGRISEMDVAALADLLHETSIRQGSFEAVAPPHDWWDWYAAYATARETGSPAEGAAATADRYMADVKGVSARSA